MQLQQLLVRGRYCSEQPLKKKKKKGEDFPLQCSDFIFYKKLPGMTGRRGLKWAWSEPQSTGTCCHGYTDQPGVERHFLSLVRWINLHVAGLLPPFLVFSLFWFFFLNHLISVSSFIVRRGNRNFLLVRNIFFISNFPDEHFTHIQDFPF